MWIRCKHQIDLICSKLSNFVVTIQTTHPMFTHFKELNKSEKSSGELLKSVKQMEESLNLTARHFSEKSLFTVFDAYLQLTDSVAQNVLKFRAKVIENQYDMPLEKERELFKDFAYLHHKFVREVLPIIAQYLKKGIAEYTEKLSEIYQEAPPSMRHFHDELDLQVIDNEEFTIGTIKKWKSILQRIGIMPVTNIRYKSMLRHFIGYIYIHQFNNYLRALIPVFGDILEMLNQNMEQDLQALRRLSRGKELDDFTENNIQGRYEVISEHIKASEKYFVDYLIDYNARFRHEIFDTALRVNANSLIRKHLRKAFPQHISAELAQFARSWFYHQTIFHNYITATLELLRIRTEYKTLTHQIKGEINERFFDESVRVVHKLQAGLEEIRNYHRLHEVGKMKEFVFDTDDILIFTDDAITTSALSDFQALSVTLPKNMALMDATYLENYRTKLQEKPHCIYVNFSVSTEYLIENMLISPIDRELQSLPVKFKKVNDHIQYFTRLVLENLNGMDKNKGQEIDLDEVLDRAEHGLKHAEEKLEELRQETEKSIERFLADTLQRFEPHEFVREIAQSEHWVNEVNLQGIRKIASSQVQRLEKIKDEARKIVGKTQEDILIAEFEQKNKPYENLYALLRNFTHQITPREEILENVPFYYRQLFTGKQLTNTTIIRNRERELKLAQEAVLHLKSGKGGAILITGDPLSGKTLFCEKAANDFLEGRVFRINPPVGGTTKVAEFIRLFREQTKTRYKGTMMDTLPQGSVLIFNDLELWWERNPTTGTAVLHRIGRMIEKYSKEYFFILNCNIYSLNFFSRITELHENLIATIPLSPFSFDKLRQTILARHYSGGLHFTYDTYPEESLPPNRSDKLFRRILDVSEGNIGMALQLWISGIREVHGEKLTMTEPSFQSMPLLGDTDKLLLISQFVFHKQVSLEKLYRIYPYGKRERLKDTVQGLYRSGVLSEIGKDTFMLNSYVMPYLIKQLKTAKLI